MAVSLLDEMRAARNLGLADLCAVAPGRRGQLAVEYLGQAERSGIAAGISTQYSRDTTSTRRAKATFCA